MYINLLQNVRLQVSVQINEVLLYSKKYTNYVEINKKILKFKKESRDLNKKVRKRVVNNLAMKLLATHSTGSMGCYLCLIIQSQFQLGRYIHACTNKMHSLANLQDLILLL